MNQSRDRQYFFILGGHPALSVAEICAYLSQKKYDFSICAAGHDYLIISTNQTVSSDILQFIGGSVKFGEIIENFKSLPTATELKVYLPNQDKIFFGLSFYPINLRGNSKVTSFHLGLALKKLLKETGQSGRLVTSKQNDLSAVVITKNKLLTKQGVELVILRGETKYYLGRTLSVQPFEQLSQRDYGRPQRDDRSGMLPPKLAQIMLNLSLSPLDGKILDPFCGSGTILQEALWQNRQHIIGSDISAQAIADSKKNLAWLHSQYDLSVGHVKLFQSAVKELSKIIAPDSLAAIITEPDLGHPDISPKNLLVEKTRLEKLYLEAYQVFFKLLKNHGRVVMVWPVFFNNNFLNIEQSLVKLGFKKILSLPDELLNIYQLNKRNNLQYARAGQKVGREITLWQKN